MGEFPTSHRDTIGDEHCFSSLKGRSIGEDHPNIRGHAMRMCLEFKGRWEEKLPLVEFAYNNSYQASIQMAPYEALYGRPRQSPVYWMEVGERSVIGQNLVKDTSKKMDLIQKLLLMAQSQQKSYVDRRR